MKRKKFWAPLIAAALLLLGGCGVPETSTPETPPPTPPREERLREELAGRWVCADADMTESVAAALSEGNEELFALCELPRLRMDAELFLAGDGHFSLSCGGEDSREAMEAVTAALESAVREHLLQTVREALAEEGIAAGAVYEKFGCADETAFLELSLGMTLEELYESMGLAAMVEDRWLRNIAEGTWAVKDGVLVLNDTAAEYDAATDTVVFENRVYVRE